MQQIAQCGLQAFADHVNATFLWTAHNEIEAKWDYIKAWDMMWINKTEVPVSQQKKYPDYPTPEKNLKSMTLKEKLEFI